MINQFRLMSVDIPSLHPSHPPQFHPRQVAQNQTDAREVAANLADEIITITNPLRQSTSDVLEVARPSITAAEVDTRTVREINRETSHAIVIRIVMTNIIEIKARVTSMRKTKDP
jgi:hypothetical protein